MTCENCGQRPATVVLERRIDGAAATINLCNHCASALAANLNQGGGGFGGLESLLERMAGPRPRRESLLGMLSEQAQLVLERAARLSLEWGHERMLPELVLLAILEEVPELRRHLADAGVPVDEYASKLEQVVPRGAPRDGHQVAMSSSIKRVLQLARAHALQSGQSFIGPEHLLRGILDEGESFASQFIARAAAQSGPREAGLDPGAAAAADGGARLPPNLSKYARDLTALAKAGRLDPVVGREREIERVTRILSRKTKNNPVLVGEPGVGKTAIAEGLAQRIVSGDVPESLRGKRVLALDLGGLLGGTKLRGEFEDRMKGLMDEIRRLQGQIILFIDELHTVVGAGGAEGAVDASNLLKPALARGELQCLGATTLEEHRKYIEKDAALERRFQPVLVAEPTQPQAIEILRGLRDTYEAHHRVKITDAALTAAVELSDRYVADRYLPDKAIDVLDEAAAMVRLGARTPPERMAHLEARLAKLEQDKSAAAASERYADAARLKAECQQLKTELEGLRSHWNEQKGTTEPIVGPEAIATIVSEWTGIPAQRLQEEEKQRLLRMEDSLRQRVVGQEEALRAVSEAVRRARAGLHDPKRPIGSFMFLGPTGVGKTETARALAEYLFDDESAMIRLDMTEYQERHTVSRLIGAPPGYVGYEDAGKLSEAVRRRPYSVVLFDEIEKAHPDVFNLLLQILDDGRLTDSRGRTVSFQNTVIVMTSNIGAERLMGTRAPLGFQGDGEDEQRRRTTDMLLDELRRHFRPEFVNRVDEIVVFQPLTREQISRIVDLMLETTRRRMRGQAVTLELTDAAKARLAERGFDPQFGARPLRRLIQREIETEASMLLLDGAVREGDTLRVDVEEDRFTFTTAPRGAPEPAAEEPRAEA